MHQHSHDVFCPQNSTFITDKFYMTLKLYKHFHKLCNLIYLLNNNKNKIKNSKCHFSFSLFTNNKLISSYYSFCSDKSCYRSLAVYKIYMNIKDIYQMLRGLIIFIFQPFLQLHIYPISASQINFIFKVISQLIWGHKAACIY